MSELKDIMESINAEKLKRITLENEFTLAKMRKLEELKKFNSIRREQIENVDAEQRYYEFKQDDLKFAIANSVKEVKTMMETIVEEKMRNADVDHDNQENLENK